jgi:glycosyl transferase, family 25
MNLRERFDRVYVINLPERADRRRDITGELERLELPLEVGKVEFFSAIRPQDSGGFMNIGTHGCFLSHYGVIRQARACKARNVLIIEDDLAIAMQFCQIVPALVERLQANDWGFIYLGHNEGPEGNGPAQLVRVPHDRALLTAHFLLVNALVFDRLLTFLELVQQRPPGHPEGGPMPVDGAYSTFRKQNPDVSTFIAAPNQGVQRSSRSDIADLKWFDRVPLLRGMVARARRTKVWLTGH